MSISEVILDRLQFAATRRLPVALAQSLTIEQSQDLVTEDLVFQLRAEIFGRRRGREEVERYWSGKVRVRPRPPRWAAWANVAIGVLMLGCALALIALQWAPAVGLVALLMAIALVVGVFVYSDEIDMPVGGTVAVPVDIWETYPEAKVALPQLGARVMVPVFDAPSFEADA